MANKVKLSKGRFKTFLKERYKMNDKEFPRISIANKIVDIFSFIGQGGQNSLTLETYS